MACGRQRGTAVLGSEVVMDRHNLNCCSNDVSTTKLSSYLSNRDGDNC